MIHRCLLGKRKDVHGLDFSVEGIMKRLPDFDPTEKPLNRRFHFGVFERAGAGRVALLIHDV